MRSGRCTAIKVSTTAPLVRINKLGDVPSFYLRVLNTQLVSSTNLVRAFKGNVLVMYAPPRYNWLTLQALTFLKN